MDITTRKFKLLESLIKEEQSEDKSTLIKMAFKKAGYQSISNKDIEKLSDLKYLVNYKGLGGMFSISDLSNLEKSLKLIGAINITFAPIGKNLIDFYIRF